MTSCSFGVSRVSTLVGAYGSNPHLTTGCNTISIRNHHNASSLPSGEGPLPIFDYLRTFRLLVGGMTLHSILPSFTPPIIEITTRAQARSSSLPQN
ncbi:hypothetical protein BDV95DRAFT_260254 [Massariosphaeria phaeospora]|uniref:Uncharacterized protein n=1 Tax=Massariosphaeria phaeospora TaxID=100035 RepID=A0A7C8I601_9PLEO|nr:hypothetical protein BDV95DRAFT_260254 [Massariosphaeria phaeospora]